MTAPTPPADPPKAPEGEQPKTFDELAKRQEQTDRKLDELIDLVKGAKPAEPGKKDEPDPSLEQRVKEELARRDQAAADETRAKEHEDLKARVAKLGETPPRQPGSRRTKLLGWGDGRG